MSGSVCRRRVHSEASFGGRQRCIPTVVLPFISCGASASLLPSGASVSLPGPRGQGHLLSSVVTGIKCHHACNMLSWGPGTQPCQLSEGSPGFPYSASARPPRGFSGRPRPRGFLFLPVLPAVRREVLTKTQPGHVCGSPEQRWRRYQSWRSPLHSRPQPRTED